jgi:glycosyltransferase involved in cell wall biosynthesis
MLNRLSLAMGLRLALWFIEFRRPWLWTYNPLSARLLSLEGFSLCIYHAVDALQEQPCMPRDLIDAEEQRLCRLVDQVFVTSPQLKRQLEPHSARIRYDPNVANQDHFAQAIKVGTAGLPSDLAVIPVPRIGFIGAVSSYKLDFDLVVAVARSKPLWQFVFIGPTGEGEPVTDISLLEKEPNIHLLGRRAYEDLPRYCAGFACGWLPLRLTPYTEAMFPMKFFEYLSAGLPVVATQIDALREFSSVAWLCDDTPESFSNALTDCLAGHGPDQMSRLALAAQHTYQARTQRMLAALEALP